MSGNVSFFLAAVVAGLAGNLVLQVLLVRVIHAEAHVRIQLVCAFLGLLITVAILLALLGYHSLSSADRAGYLLLHVLIYCSFSFCLFNVINANVSSLRVRLLREYLLQYPLPVADATVLERYPVKQIIKARLARLEKGRQIDRRAERYYARRGLVSFICWCFAALRLLLLGA